MKRRIFSFITILILLFSFYTISLSYDGLEDIGIRRDKLLFKMDNKNDLKVDCLYLEGAKYIPVLELPNLIRGEIIFNEDHILLKDYVDFPETDYLNGEKFIYGSILKVDYERKEIVIEQDMDDNDIEIFPILKAREDVILIVERKDKRMNIDFEDLKLGDRLGVVLDKEGMIRGIIMGN